MAEATHSAPGSVAIVGGGLAGLAAARTLHKGGVKCTVFEASDRLGGRVRSEKIDGVTVDHGLQTLNSWYPSIKEILQPGEYSSLGIRNFQPAIQTLTEDGLALICDPIRAPHLIPSLMRSNVRSALSFRDLVALRRWLKSELSHRSSLELRKIKQRHIDEDVKVCESLDQRGVHRRTRCVAIDPLLRAFLFDLEGESSAIFAKWMIGTMLRGNLAVLENGMGDLATTLARVPSADFRLNSPVTSIEEAGDGVLITVGESVEDGTNGAGGNHPATSRTVTDREVTEHFSHVIVAVDPRHETALLGSPKVPTTSVSSWWFISEEPVTAEGLMTVDGTRKTPITSATEVTAVAPGYAPGQHLVACNHVHPQGGNPSQVPSVAEVQRGLGSLFGVDSSSWELVAEQLFIDAIPLIRPKGLQRIGKNLGDRELQGSRIALAGAQHATPSIDGVLRSGQRAANFVLSKLTE